MRFEYERRCGLGLGPEEVCVGTQNKAGVEETQQRTAKALVREGVQPAS